MNTKCKYCDQPCKPRPDRPGKFFTMCEDHLREYVREKARESYDRHKEDRVQRARDWRKDNPDSYKESYERYEEKPNVKERKRKYMKTYKRPWREHVGDHCERCGFIPEDLRQLDPHHIDENKNNNDPSNIETLCANCHRVVKHQPGRSKEPV